VMRGREIPGADEAADEVRERTKRLTAGV
jgi:hypothetical protein